MSLSTVHPARPRGHRHAVRDEPGYLRRRGSSSLAKKIEAFFRISFASRNSRFSLSSSLIRVCSALNAGTIVSVDLGLKNPPAQ